ncbi:hypothetical protein FHS96_000722 [Sphingomonas zeicaulis]|uniref:hypothetical protein n=1 Tax=Sphingomonas zeicaulis TaxID=1632740 RepID=UPI003D1DDBF0
MHHVDVKGDWHLVGFAQASGEAGLIGEESDQADIDAWLNGSGEALAASALPIAGLSLTIDADMNLTERCDGTPKLTWFDAEGVLVEDVTPINGPLIGTGPVRYLRPDTIASWAVPRDGRHGPAILRYDDGDTKIVDAFALAGEQLVRTVNVVTDELCFNRAALFYARDEP